MGTCQNKHINPVLFYSKVFFRCSVLWMALSNSSIAESAPASFYPIPVNIQQKICNKLIFNNEQCGANRSIKYKQIQKLDNDQILLFFTINNLSTIRQVAVIIDGNGRWKVGDVFDGVPEKIINDHGGYWMHVQSYNEGTSPSLYYSRDGIKWEYIHLPAKRQRGSTIEEMTKLCYNNGNVMITLDTMMFVPKEKQVISSWKAQPKKLIERLKQRRLDKIQPSIIWHQIENKTVTLKCQTARANNNTWLIKEDGDRTMIQHVKKNLNIIINHTVTIPQRRKRTLYAIQVGVYQNKIFANELIQSLRKEGFRTYTRELPVNGIKMTKIYIGTFWAKRFAQQNLLVLKKKFTDRKPIQSAYIVEDYRSK